MIKIIGFDGSPFAGGTTARILARAIEASSKAGAETEIVRLIEVIDAPFHGVYNPAALATKRVYDALPTFLQRAIPRELKRAVTEHLIPEGLRPVISKVEAADGLILATPTWWGAPSDYMKTFINYLTICSYRGFSLKGKAAAFMSVCEEDGAQSANMLMYSALAHMGFVTTPFSSFFYNRNMQGRSEGDWQERGQELLGVNIVRLATLLKEVSWDWYSAK